MIRRALATSKLKTMHRVSRSFTDEIIGRSFTQVVTGCTLSVNEHSARNRGGYPNTACLRTE